MLIPTHGLSNDELFAVMEAIRLARAVGQVDESHAAEARVAVRKARERGLSEEQLTDVALEAITAMRARQVRCAARKPPTKESTCAA